MRGRKPKPTEQRRIEGNPGHRPLNDAEPVLDVVADTFDAPPPELDGIAVAQQEWQRLAPMLRRARQITDADRAALLALCIEWARYVEAREKAHPRVIKSPSGYPMPNPWLSIQTKALQGCMKLWPELGLTPSSRSRVRADGGGAENEFSEFLDDAPSSDVGTRH